MKTNKISIVLILAFTMTLCLTACGGSSQESASVTATDTPSPAVIVPTVVVTSNGSCDPFEGLDEMKWEYKTIVFVNTNIDMGTAGLTTIGNSAFYPDPYPDRTETLNRLGSEGWEMVNYQQETGGISDMGVYVFKKLIVPTR